eukprot:TRINITY_DN112160_c0_g1_i1.p1 TRINITY_DN112160_c0_g1~~TRINITY_DN112160_c0_g1_i1.p1  ORF type:complete len:102 (+),score=3.26 TRINITY_DN112160_c0_g1_i1:28-306(+)
MSDDSVATLDPVSDVAGRARKRDSVLSPALITRHCLEGTGPCLCATSSRSPRRPTPMNEDSLQVHLSSSGKHDTLWTSTLTQSVAEGSLFSK